MGYMNLTGMVFDVQRFSLHDGPGIRTTVFLKGCSLHCFWCHNPEGMVGTKQIQFTESRCITCGACVANCPQGAHQIFNGKHVYDRSLCQECGICVQNCFTNALLAVGKKVTIQEIMQEVMADHPFYETSGGGVTLSGGEPALQPEFAVGILKECKEEGIHTAIETCANVPWSFLENLVSLADLIMMDLKHLDDRRHREVTGASNQRILENAKKIVHMNKPVRFRTPVIPSVNDSSEAIAEIAKFILQIKASSLSKAPAQADITWELLPFHKLAADKYRSLGLEYKAQDLDILTKERIAALAEDAKNAGMPVKIVV